MTAREVVLEGGSPWGFRMTGGADVGHALRISRVNPGSKAAQVGVREGDVITAINGTHTRCLTNGESHALLRGVTGTLRLGLNQDSSGSPKRRSKEPLKREASNSSSQSTPTTPGAPSTPTPTPGPVDPVSSSSTPSDPSTAGAKVFVCGIWNSVSKTKQRGKNAAKTEASVKPAETSKCDPGVAEAVPKASASKARRMRKMKLKNAKKDDQCCPDGLSNGDANGEGRTDVMDSVQVDIVESVRVDQSDEKVEVVVMDEEDVRGGSLVTENNEPCLKELGNDTPVVVVESTENNTSKSKTKKKNKSKGFSLSNIFSSKSDKGMCNSENNPALQDQCSDNEKCKEVDHKQECFGKQDFRISAAIAKASAEMAKMAIPPANVDNKLESNELVTKTDVDVTVLEDSKTNSLERKFKTSPIINPSTTFTLIENESPNRSKHSSVSSSPSSTLKSNKAVKMGIEKTSKPRITCKNDSIPIDNKLDKNNKADDLGESSKSNSATTSGNNSRPISIFVMPPDNVAEETETAKVDWESVTDFDTSSTWISSDDDDVHPETLIHLPSNDLESAAALKDGRNGIIQHDDYELSVRDLHSPFLAPEEEATLRSFLETLNLTKPEEYDDSSSSKSYGESSTASMSESTASMTESSPVPPTPMDEIVVYRHVKSHSVAEQCFIPPNHRRFLDVITEETSDPSDSEKRNAAQKPWENTDAIRQNNDIEIIPNDWYGSEEEPETTSDEGGIDTSWREGRKLEDVEGIEIVFLSDDSNDEETLSKTFQENILPSEKKEDLPELVIVHTVEADNSKNKVILRNEMKSKNYKSENRDSKHAMDEILSILDSTYEINRDIFMSNPLNDNMFKNKSNPVIKPARVSIFDIPKALPLKQSVTIREIEPAKKNVTNVYGSSSKASVDNDYIAKEKSIVQESPSDKFTNEQHSNEQPVAQEVLVAMTPPPLSRQGSSSSATSQSTAKYNGHSPMSSEAEDKNEDDVNHTKTGKRHHSGRSPQSSEAEDKIDNEAKKRKKIKRCYNPKSLTNLSKEAISYMPHGDFYLKKIGIGCSTEIENEVNSNNKGQDKITSLPPSGISTRRSSFHELDNIYAVRNHANCIDRESSPSRPMLITSPPPSALTSPPPNDDPWMGLPTSTDPRLLVCLSPSQSKDMTVTSPKEATELLDLHKKFVERRGYHESSKRNSICSPRSEGSRTPDLNSPDLIRLEPYTSKKAQVYTPELLIEAANLLALKEYRQSRFKSGPQSNSFRPETDVKINGNVLEKNDGLSGVTSPPGIAAGSEDLDSNRSAGTSRLLALLQGGVERPTTGTEEMDRADKSVKETTRVHGCSGSYLSEWLTMSENVCSNTNDRAKTDVNRNIIEKKSVNDSTPRENVKGNENGIVERRQFEADKYKISKQGDIAIIHTREDTKKPPKGKSERPKSLPPTGVDPSNELFREQMYNEYMDRVAERVERRQQKVIKISSRPASVHLKSEPDNEKILQNPVESEFMNKVRERMSKLGIDLDGETDGEKTEQQQKPDDSLPKHLQEFMELTEAAAAAAAAPQAENAGVWSPGATPEPQRKEFNFSAVKEESAKEDSEPPVPVWTPKSAQASPTTERKAFRPVNFESPKLSRKTYNQTSSEETPKPPTDLPLALDSPSHSQTSSISSSTQYLSTTRETHSSSTQESSSRLVTSHSLPDTSLPRAQNPTITLLQKAREGQIPKGAQYLDHNSTNDNDSRSSPSGVHPNEVLYSVRKEYESETEDKRPKKIVELGPRKYDGIGPVTKEGIPIVLRSEVQDENQQRWYKRMYDSLHKAERDKEYVTVRYKTRRGRYPYTNPGGYQSEPEPIGSYDSDSTSAKYATLDRRRIRNKENDFTTSTMPRSKYNAVKHGVDVYKNQPGRIEDYEPGHSSIADKETKQWWDEVMDIFDGQFEQTQKNSPRTHTPATSTNKPFMTYALKESGYESDSTLVFKRRDETQQQLSPAEQKQAYKVIQKGGDVPLHGLRKPVPEKPKEPLRGRVPAPGRSSYPPHRRPESPHRYVESEVTIHYRSPVRSEEKEAWPEEELQRRQAEAMRRIYQEERRRKYLQELQDMYSRRHTDNFTPSQKSPIPLNRYDDFVDDLSPGKPRDRTPEPKLVARALYNFVGQTSRELTFRRGDIIYVRRQIDKNWYEGEHNAMIGLFPINYVEIIPYDGIRTIPKRPTEGQARAKFNFQAQTHLELPLVKGELVLLTRRVDNNWFEGRIGNRKGIFPVSYVDVLVEPGERAMSPVRVQTPTKPVASPAAHSLHISNNMSHHYQPPRPVSYTSLPRQKTVELKQPPVNQTLHIDTQNEPVPYRVLYNYKPQNDDELELVEGETVYVMEKCDDGWYVGSSHRTGYLGTFPGNYVERVV